MKADGVPPNVFSQIQSNSDLLHQMEGRTVPPSEVNFAGVGALVTKSLPAVSRSL